MNDEIDESDSEQFSLASSSSIAALVPIDPEWRPIFHNSESNQVVLYNPTSHALSIRKSVNFPRKPRPPCPYCKQTLPLGFEPDSLYDGHDESLDADPIMYSRASNYFRLLAVANESTSSRPATRGSSPIDDMDERSNSNGNAFPPGAMAEGYFKAFFQEEYKLGMGANGSVYLCQHMLDGNPLGHFAVKKIAVGNSQSYLLSILREVRLLERLHHPNIITYHHAWLESCQFSNFGPKVPTLHVLMQWAEGGSLDDFIDVRLGRQTGHNNVWHYNPPLNLQNPFAPSPSNSPFPSPGSVQAPSPQAPQGQDSIDMNSRAARIRAFRAFQKATPEEKERMRRTGRGNGSSSGTWSAIHLLSADEIKSLVQGHRGRVGVPAQQVNIAFGFKACPRAMLSDFGTSRDMISSGGVRSGNTGTLEYTAPESLPSPQTGYLRQIDSKADMWSLGMILHKMLFFKLPYRYASRGNESGEPCDDEKDKMAALEHEVLSYPGFKSDQSLATAFEVRRIPKAILVLLESLLNPLSAVRPTCEMVSSAIRQGKYILLENRMATCRFSMVPEEDHNLIHRLRSLNSRCLAFRSEEDLDADGDSTSDSEIVEYYDATTGSQEKMPLLGLPAPDNSEIVEEGVEGHGLDESTFNLLRSQSYRGYTLVGLRTLKAIVLICKVTLLPCSWFCAPADMHL
ncbi:putative serine/threonine-protein kinase iks1 [Paramarasmius palmivorus]|uniref:non-specific serine/threonine protein kinase n=1 Tax=Paramarasmius palmivorus TaxID=297713 RepID=A0AAW0BYB5_9AGAR